VQVVLRASARIGDLIFQQTQKKEEIVVPGLIEASDRRYPLARNTRTFRKHCSIDTGSEAGMTGFLCVLKNFGGSILMFESTSIEFNKFG